MRKVNLNSSEISADIETYGKKDSIRPGHYKGKKDLIASWQDTMSDEEFRGAMKALIHRYTFRYDKKGGIQDLDKATECIRRLKEWEQSL